MLAWFFMLSFVLLHLLFPDVFAASVSDVDGVKKSIDAYFAGFQQTSFQIMMDTYEMIGSFMNPSDASVGFVGVLPRLVFVVAAMLTFVFSLTVLLKEIPRNDGATMEMIERWGIRLLMTIFFIFLMGEYILPAIYRLGAFIIHYTEHMDLGPASAVFRGDGENTGYYNSVRDTIGEAFGKSHMLQNFNPYSNGVNPFSDQTLREGGWYQLQKINEFMEVIKLIQWAPVIAAVFLTATACIEMKIRQLLAPMAIASFAYNDEKSTGIRFLKKYLSSFVKIAIYFVIAYIGLLFQAFCYIQILQTKDNAQNDVSIALVLFVLAPIVTAMAMMQSSGVADEVVGV